MSLKSRIEAVLFLTDKPMPAMAIAQLVNADVQEVRQSILELIHDYELRNSALEIADDGGYMMQVKDEYATFANDMAPIDLPVSVVRTLSAIAIKQPVLQSEIVRIRGAGAYDHVKELLEKELITKKEEGRSSLLSTTKKFQEYFRLSQDARALRTQLKEQAKPDDKSPETAEAIVAENTTDTSTALETENTTIQAEPTFAEIENTLVQIENTIAEVESPAAETEIAANETEGDNTAAEVDNTPAEDETDTTPPGKANTTDNGNDIAMLASTTEFAPSK